MILVTGATGFLGEHVVKQFTAAGEKPACFVRSTSDTSSLEKLGLPILHGDLSDVDSLSRALECRPTLVNIASLGFGHAPAIMDACRRSGVKRAIFISTTAIFTNLEAGSKSVRQAAERCVESSDLDWTILRPTMIYGTERDRNMARLVRYLARFPVIPVIGGGERLQQPVHVEDLAQGIVNSVHCSKAARRSYNLSGKLPLTFNQIIDTTAAALARRVLKVHVPMKPVLRLLELYERMVARPILKAEQVLRLDEDKAFSHEEAILDFGYTPRTFEEGIRAEVSRLRELGLVRSAGGTT
ncbi:MAG: NAD(P)H-binding protein [Armatimonadota bacterium]|nr:NAD(P)H-binding protein [Armatimonadota bacterium]